MRSDLCLLVHDFLILCCVLFAACCSVFRLSLVLTLLFPLWFLSSPLSLRTMQVLTNSSFTSVLGIFNFCVAEVSAGHRPPCITATGGKVAPAFLFGLRLLTLFQAQNSFAWFDMVTSLSSTGAGLFISADEPSRACIANFDSFSTVTHSEFRIIAVASDYPIVQLPRSTHLISKDIHFMTELRRALPCSSLN